MMTDKAEYGVKVVSKNPILERVKDYLSLGGLFNPELMDHKKVRNLIMDCRDEIAKRDKLINQIVIIIEETGTFSHEEGVEWLKKVKKLNG